MALHFTRNIEVDVPDLAAWRRARMPDWPEDHRFTVVPDWVCEVLSDSTESKDCNVKMPIYAHFGVAYAWLVDPRSRQVEAYELTQGRWQPIGRYIGAVRARIPPFDAVEIDIGRLWRK